MRARAKSYHMLICSLPALPRRFDGRLPLSAERLRERLRMLEPGDAEEIRSLLEILDWNDRFAETTDAAVVRRYAELTSAITSPLVRELATSVVDVRMIVAALRRRRLGLGPPAVGIGRWFGDIRRHYGDPDLGLSHSFRRIPELRRSLEDGDALGFHRGLIEASWGYLRKRSSDHHFDFGAVALYVARWAIVHHWHQLEAGRGQAIFETLVAEALGEHADVHA